MIDVGAEGLPGRVEAALISPSAYASDGDETALFRRIGARDVHSLELDFEAEIRALEEELARATRGAAGTAGRERALVVGVTREDDRLEELLELARSAAVEVAGVIRQKRPQVHPKTVVGRGKLKEVVFQGMRRRATVALFDIDLKPAQARAFEDATGLKTIDRTQLILDIFAQRARSRDGKLQVELAQLKYSLPRLTDADAGLSRLTGGIGGRGPGETVMEIGRRRIRDRIRTLERQIEKLSQQRDLRRRRRRRDVAVLSIIGYTNAGKSTLLNSLTHSRIEAADQLFNTLDPTRRRLRFPREGDVIITDTVGFISDLPRDLLNAFRATLEELADADLLLHVVDAADEGLERKKRAVERLVGELGLGDIPRVIALNKVDRLQAGQAQALARRLGGVAVSAAARTGLGDLIAAAEGALAAAAAPAS
jgi:GTPase